MKKRIILIFFAVLTVKIALTFLVILPNYSPDEGCEILIAKHFAESFNISTCDSLADLQVYGIMPLYTIIISISYLFLKAMSAYKGILIINALLASTLVFPLMGIFRKHIKSKIMPILGTIFIVFLPDIQIYETMVKSDILFITINIWFLYLYIKSFEKKKSTQYKLLTLFTAILSIFSRPYGFITIIAFLISEFFVSTKKRLFALLSVLTFLIIIATINYFLPGTFGNLYQKLTTLSNPENIYLLMIAFKNQINSFTIATYLIPILVFINYFKNLGKIRIFLLSFILINFLISTQHIYGYLYDSTVATGLLTRYISIPIIYMMIFGTVGILSKKTDTMKIPKIFTSIALLSLLFFTYHPVSLGINSTLHHYYDSSNFDTVYGIFISKIFVFVVLGLLLLFAFQKRKIIIPSIISIMLISTIGLIQQVYTRGTTEKLGLEWQLFAHGNSKIIYVMEGLITARTYLNLKTLTENEVDITSNEINPSDYDYIVTNLSRFTDNPEMENIGMTYHFESIYKPKIATNSENPNTKEK